MGCIYENLLQCNCKLHHCFRRALHFLKLLFCKGQYVPQGAVLCRKHSLIHVFTGLSLLKIKHQHGYIIKLRGTAHKAVDITFKIPEHFFCRIGLTPVKQAHQPFLAIKLSVPVGGLCHSVRIEKDSVPRVQSNLALPVPCGVHACQNEAGS